MPSATARRTERKRSPGLILRGFRRTNPIWIARTSKNLDDGTRLVSAPKADLFCIESRARQPSICQENTWIYFYCSPFTVKELWDLGLRVWAKAYFEFLAEDHRKSCERGE